MAKFYSTDGRVLDEKDVVKAVKYYEFLFNAKHKDDVAKSDRSNRGGGSPKPAAKLRKALENYDVEGVVVEDEVVVSVKTIITITTDSIE